MIVIKGLSKSFGKHKVLDNINLKIEKGKITIIMGGSGCGKSTLLKHLIGALKPDKGEILVEGNDITKMDENSLDNIRKKFGMLYQNGALFNSMSVGENVALPLREHTKLDNKIIEIVVKMKLELVGLTGFNELFPSQISGGMKKRVALARAIALDPQVVFYDEPGAGLDPVTRSVIDKLIADLSKKLNITSIVVTHEMGSAFTIADKIAMVHQGKIIANGTISEIKNSENEVVQQFISGSPEGPLTRQRSGKEYLESLT